jgi:hypothetical protein
MNFNVINLANLEASKDRPHGSLRWKNKTCGMHTVAGHGTTAGRFAESTGCKGLLGQQHNHHLESFTDFN